MMLPLVSTWIGVVAYSLIVGVAVTWIGIGLANWMARHRRSSFCLGGGALCFAVYFASILIIVSDWFPAFSGPYVALFMRIMALLGALALVGYTAIYLNCKRKMEPC
jgi:hypothetical protein